MTMPRRPFRSGAPWLAGYAVVVLCPIAIAAIARRGADTVIPAREAAIAAGLAGLAMLAVQLALVSRMRGLSTTVGLDALLQLHRELAIVAFAAVSAHVVMLLPVTGAGGLVPIGHPRGLIAGIVAFWLALVIGTTSLARRRLRLSYEVWQILHLCCAIGIVIGGIAHALGSGRYTAAPAMRAVLGVYVVLFGGLLLRYRVLRPLAIAPHRWAVVANVEAGGSTRLLTLQAIDHGGFRFDAGQFAWITTGRSPLLSQQHPLSIASSPEMLADRRHVQFAIKALGDWSGQIVPALPVGHRAWIDGPYGAFTLPAGDRPIVLIAGGIGIAPMRGMLLHARDARLTRPFTLVYAAADRTRLAFEDELGRLTSELTLKLVLVLERPAAAWAGERGLVTAELLRRHVPMPIGGNEYFICGPLPMIDAFEGIRAELAIARARVHTERFQVV